MKKSLAIALLMLGWMARAAWAQCPAGPGNVPNVAITGNLSTVTGMPAVNQRVMYQWGLTQQPGSSITTGIPGGSSCSVFTDTNGNLPTPPATCTCFPQGASGYVTIGSGEPAKITFPPFVTADLSTILPVTAVMDPIVSEIDLCGQPTDIAFSVANPPIGTIGPATLCPGVVTGLQGFPICTTPPTDGQELTYSTTTNQWCGVNEAPGPGPSSSVNSGMSFPIMSYNGECNDFGNGQPYPPTTATTIAGNTTITVANATGFVKNGGILLKHVGAASSSSSAPSAPVVTAVKLVTGETHTVSPNTGVVTFTTTNHFVEDYSVRLNQSSTSLWRVNNGVTPTISQYAAPPSSPSTTGIYNVSTVNMTTPTSVLNSIYWQPDTTDATTYCYETRFVLTGLDDTTPTSPGACTTTAAATLGMGLNNTTGLPIRGVAVNWGVPPSGATGVEIYRSTDAGVTYAPYWGQPVADTTTLFAGVQSNIYIDEGSAIGPYFAPPIADNNLPPVNDNVAYAKDLRTTIVSITPTTPPAATMVLAVAPSVSGTPMTFTDDTQALHDTRIACGAVGGGFVDIPMGCRITYQNAENFPDLYGNAPSNGCTLRGTKNYVSGGGASITITGSGNGACSFFDNTKGGIELYPFVNVQNIEMSCQDNGSTNFLLGCLFSNGSTLPNGSSRILRSGNGGPVTNAQATKGNCPNAVGLVLTGSANRVEEPYFVRMKRVAEEGGNGTVLTGPGDIGFPYQLKYPIWEHIGGQPFTSSGVVTEIGPNCFVHDGNPTGGPFVVSGMYCADSPDQNGNNFCTGAGVPFACCTGNNTGTCGFDLGDNTGMEFGTHGNGFGDPNGIIQANLIATSGPNQMVLMSAGSTIQANQFYFLSSTVNGLLIQDGTQGNFSNNTLGVNFFGGTGAGGGADIVDDATLGQNTFESQFFNNHGVVMNQVAIDLTNATDSGDIQYNASIDSQNVGCATCYMTDSGLQTSIVGAGKIPKWHHLHAYQNNTDSSDTMMNVSIGSGRFDTGKTCAEATGAGCLIAFKKGNTQNITIADTTAFSVGCTGTPLVVNEQGHLVISAAAGVTPGHITPTACIAVDSSFPATGHPAAGDLVNCPWTVVSANQVVVGPCSADVAPAATPTPTPTPAATNTPAPTQTMIATPTPMPTP